MERQTDTGTPPANERIEPGRPARGAGPLVTPERAARAAERIGSDIVVAMCAWDPDSSRHALFFPPTRSNVATSPIRIRRESSLLPHVLQGTGPYVSNDLSRPAFEEERQLKQAGIAAYVAIPVSATGWRPGMVLFGCESTNRFDALTVGALLDQVEHWKFDTDGGAVPEATEPEEEPATALDETVIGESQSYLEICRLIAIVAKQETTVLIQGESGTGKELLAKTIHRYSRRSERPFVRVNCAALTETLIESEMFGHRKGAFTGAIYAHRGRFEMANGGTLLLDEIGNMTLAGQAKLLRVLQEREFEPVGQTASVKVDVRIIATTNVDLETAIAEGRFRQDLYYRLAVVPITVPPLRLRRKDILPLARYFLAQTTARLGKSPLDLSQHTQQVLESYDWPGNARELRNAVEYAALVARQGEIAPPDLPSSIGELAAGAQRDEKRSLREKLLAYERQVVTDAFCRAGGRRKEIAEILGIDPRNVSYFLKKHEIR
jgi:transcriptional regulator with GAF, ATPase, and Fis domain